MFKKGDRVEIIGPPCVSATRRADIGKIVVVEIEPTLGALDIMVVGGEGLTFKVYPASSLKKVGENMKLVIKDQKPEETEEVVELWLERRPNGEVEVKSRSSKKEMILREAAFYPNGTASSLHNSNFKWDK